MGRTFVLSSSASVPYARLKGVSPVGSRNVVRYAQRMLYKSSTHYPLDRSSLALSPCKMVQLVTSVSPFVWGWATEVKR